MQLFTVKGRGMQEDATEDEEGAVVDGDDDWYLRDPKKILRGWYLFFLLLSFF